MTAWTLKTNNFYFPDGVPATHHPPVPICGLRKSQEGRDYLANYSF